MVIARTGGAAGRAAQLLVVALDEESLHLVLSRVDLSIGEVQDFNSLLLPCTSLGRTTFIMSVVLHFNVFGRNH